MIGIVSKAGVYVLSIALAAALAFGGWQWSRAHSERTAHAQTKAEHAEVLKGLAEKTARVVVAINAREREIRGLLDSSNKAREEGIANAITEQQRVVAAVRDESLRLRKQWRGCPTATAVSGDAGTGSGPDDAAELRATGAGDLVRVGDDADVQIAGLQAYARACQALTQPINP